MTIPCPRIIVAGTHSGVGKTSVTLALVSALRRRGLRVQPFKVGPDYLDPTYLTTAAGRPCYNLDGWMTGKDYVQKLFAERASGSDIAVIEGVMGLFDGSDPVAPEGSTAEIAAWLDAPVILVTDVHGLSRSIAALVKGYMEFDSSVRLAGVVANNCGTERHGAWLAESLEASHLPRLVAAIPRGAFPELPRRHLGLVSADANILGESVLSSLGGALERYGSVDRILHLARQTVDVPVVGSPLTDTTPGRRVRLGIARDAAFHFYYPDNLEALAAAGCDLVKFSPIADSELPDNLDALYLGGGYPEEHAEELSANMSMIESVRRFAARGKPVYAECGGLMYLSQGVESREGKRFFMVGLLPWWTRMLDRIKSLGYVEVALTKDSLFGTEGSILRGHEFHYSELVGDPTDTGEWTTTYRIRYRRKDEWITAGFQKGNILAGYVHMHFASKPGAVDRFLSVCRNSG
ncbi:MAG: cobyrinate a,c-diamide synthase [Desulfomonile sp.]|nr:cobyrinate a,c-diamide synthase [Desulfomonile sp.]